jgi:hypothetical protein
MLVLTLLEQVIAFMGAAFFRTTGGRLKYRSY